MRWVARGEALVCEVLPAVEPVPQTGIDPHVLERLEMMKVSLRRYLEAVRERAQGAAYYRPPREKLTIVP
jgi:hypothetical protein